MAALKVGAAYARVSTQDQASYNYSLPEQIAAIRAYARQHGVHIPVEYEFKDAHTGTRIERPSLDALRGLVQSGKAQAIVIHSASRLSRVTRDSIQLRDEFVEAGAEIHVVESGKFNPQDNSQVLMWDIRAAISDNERRTILARMMAGKRRKAIGGEWVGSHHTPLGYKRVYNDNGSHRKSSLAIDPAGARIVRLIFKLYTGKMMTLRAVVAKLEADGIKPARAKLWAKQTIHHILTNELYIGRAIYSGIVAELPDLAIIDKATFEAAQKRLKRNKELAAPNLRHPFLLAGFVYCRCGRRMTQKARNWASQRRYYICISMSMHTFNHPGCGSPLINMGALDDKVWQYVLDSVSDESIARGLAYHAARREAEPDSRTAELERVESELDRLNKRVAIVMAQFDNAGDQVMTVITENIRAISGQIATLEKKRAELLTARESEQGRAQMTASIAEQIKQVRAGLARASLAKRRRLMDIINLRCELISYDERRRTFRISSDISEPLEFELVKFRPHD